MESELLKMNTDNRLDIEAVENCQNKKIKNYPKIKREQVQSDSESLKEALVKKREFQRLIFQKKNYYKGEMKKLGFKILGNVISKSSKRIQHFDATFQKYEGLRYVSQGFKRFNLLQHLSLKFIYRQVNNLEVDCLGRELKKLTSLQSLCLYFSWCFNLHDESFSSLMNGLRGKSHLIRLSLDFNCCESLSCIGFQSFSQALKTLISLQDLHLRFQCRTSNRIDDVALLSLKKSFMRLTSLRRLSLVFRSGGISDVGFSRISESIKKLLYLESLALDFSCCTRITENGLKSLGEALKEGELNSLLKLDLNFSHCEGISEEGFISLHESFKAHGNLTSLHLNYQYLTDAGMISLSENIRGLLSLKDIDLSFVKYSENTVKGLLSLGEALTNLKSLKRFGLGYLQCPSLDDTGLISLSKGLQELSCLKEISIELFKCERITDVGVKWLGECLERISCLKKISLDFSECGNMSDLGLASLVGSVMKLESLIEVNIYLVECGKISLGNKKELQKILEDQHPIAIIKIV